MWPRQPTPKFDGDRREGGGGTAAILAATPPGNPITRWKDAHGLQCSLNLSNGELCIARALPPRRGSGEKARERRAFGGLERRKIRGSRAQRREPIARMHHNEIALAIEKKAIESRAEGKGWGRKEEGGWKRRQRGWSGMARESSVHYIRIK